MSARFHRRARSSVVEHSTFNRMVDGSNPSGLTNMQPHRSVNEQFWQVVRNILLSVSLAIALGNCSDDSRLSISGYAEVIDGDTIIITGRHIRFQGIDAPEISQACEDEAGHPWDCGREAARALDRLIGRQIVGCSVDPLDSHDRYGRNLGWCKAGEKALSIAMVRAGWAVVYHGTRARHFLPAGLIAAEDEARKSKRGIWRGRFQLPWEWRAVQHPRH